MIVLRDAIALRPFRRDLVQILAGGLLLTFLYCGSDWQADPSFVEWAHRLPDGTSSRALVWFAEHLRIFRNAAIPLDNNASEAALRVVALLRKNALFLGHDESGENHAILLTLVATCQLHDINPERYIADVLLRVQSHPASRLDELLPQNWKNLFGPSAST